jgi:integrase
MITFWRRHSDECPQRKFGRDSIKCNCPIWADGYVEGRRTLRRSLKTRDMARARKKAASLEDTDHPPYKTVTECVEAFLAACNHLAENTQRKYRNRLQKQLIPFCEQKGIDSIAELNTETIDAFRANRKLALTTSSRELDTLRQFLSFCVDRNWIKDNAARKIKPPRNIKPKEVDPYTKTELDAILDAAGRIGKADYERLRARAAVLLLRHTALRISDVALLRRDRVENGELLIHTKKTGATVRLPLPKELVEALNDVPMPRGAEEGRHFFINGSGSARTAISVMERCLRAVFKLSGVAGARAHRFRHTLATDILANGGSLGDVADILGISEAIAEKHYAKWSPARQDRISAIMRARFGHGKKTLR